MSKTEAEELEFLRRETERASRHVLELRAEKEMLKRRLEVARLELELASYNECNHRQDCIAAENRADELLEENKRLKKEVQELLERPRQVSERSKEP